MSLEALPEPVVARRARTAFEGHNYTEVLTCQDLLTSGQESFSLTWGIIRMWTSC